MSSFITAYTSIQYRNSNSSLRRDHQMLLNEIQINSNEIITHDEQILTNKLLLWGDLFPQILASVVAFMLVTQPGINMVYSNIFLNHFEFTDVYELSWLCIVVLCMPIGAITIGIIMDRIGRKNALLLTCVPLLFSWSIASMAHRENMDLIYACRFLAGIGGGMTSASIIYVSEIAHSSYRQMLLSLNSVFFSIGVLFATTVSSLAQWQAVNVIFFILTAVTVILLVIILPESPVWLAKFRSDRVYEATNSLRRIYPRNDQVFAEEWDRLYYVMSPLPPSTIRDAFSPSQICTDPALRDHVRCRGPLSSQRCGNWCGWLSCSATQPPTVTRPIRLLAVLFLLQQLSGCYTMIFYAIPIYRSVVGTTVAGSEPSQMDTLVVFGVVRLVSSVLACAVSLHVGRRPLLIASSLAMAVSAALVAFTCSSAATAVRYGDPDVEVLDVGDRPAPATGLPLFGIMAFVCSGSAGVLVFPWTLVGELLPISVRAVAGAILVSYANVLMFAALKTLPYFVTFVDGRGDGSVAAAFVVFAVASSVMAAYTYAYLPETLGKGLDEIEQYFADPPPGGRQRLGGSR